MRLFITIAKKDGAWAAVAGPNHDYETQSREFKAAKIAGGNGFEAMQLWGSSLGCVKRAEFKPLASAPPAKPAKGKIAK